MACRVLVFLIYLKMTSDNHCHAAMQGKRNPFRHTTRYLPPPDPSWIDANITNVFLMWRRKKVDLEDFFKCPGHWFRVDQFIWGSEFTIFSFRSGPYYCVIRNITMYSVFLIVINKPLTLSLKDHTSNQTMVYVGQTKTLICDAIFAMDYFRFISWITIYNQNGKVIDACNQSIYEHTVISTCKSEIQFSNMGSVSFTCSMNYAAEYNGRRADNMTTTSIALTVQEPPKDHSFPSVAVKDTKPNEKNVVIVSTNTKQKISLILFVMTEWFIYYVVLFN